ncbi:hypothetical protein [Streptomyces sp. NPDC050534]|uniref:hypothetical protein n=1 Tax=Streptomyces sp. NPDC050534 TaxID=3365625 RepID=UPI00379323C5
MADRGWYDDSDAHDAVRQADRATRLGWAAIAGTAGALGCALIAVAVVCLAAILACAYVVVAMD